MTKSIVYYTDNRTGEPIISLAKKYIAASGLPIVSCSLQPIDFGENYVLKDRVRSYPTMVEQILIALKHSTSDYVFFCEHDVLYHKSHFDFTPPTDTIYYYNVNNWRWRYPTNVAICYDYLASLSALCCNRKLALDHFERRLRVADEQGLSKLRSREPIWARRWGYEPGTKKVRRGGFSDESYEIWKSEYPNIDIRHKWTLSHPKTFLSDFRHAPRNWREIDIRNIPEWDLKTLFNLTI